jgi:outer membrane protein assembly factor BamB
MSQPDSTIVHCPSCGSPITLGATSGTCSYCHTVVERRPGAPQSEPIVASRTRKPAQARPARSAQRGAAGCVIAIIGATVLFVCFILAVTTSSLRQVGSLLGIGYHGWPLFSSERVSDLVRVVPRDAASDDMLVFLSQDQNILLGLIDSTGSTLRWQTPPLSKQARQSLIALGPDLVYVADQTRLQALHLSDGKPAWQASLSVEPPSGCDACLMLVGDRVIVQQKDHTLQAFDAQTGQPGWHLRLAAQAQHIPLVGGKLALIQQSEGQSGAEIQVIDPDSGAITRRLTPACTRADPDAESATFYTSSPLLSSPDGAALFTFLEGSHDCLQRWGADADQPIWQVWLNDGIAPSSWTVQNTLLADQHMFIANDGVLSVLDTTSGAVTTLMRDKEYHLTPLFARGTLVVVKATPDWDRTRNSLWALDTTSGERRWEFAIQAKEWFGDSGFNEWGAQLTPNGVAVVQVPNDAHQLIVDRIDLQTGTSAGQQVTKLDDSSTTVWDNRWTERAAWLQIGSKTYTVDLLSGAVVEQAR